MKKILMVAAASTALIASPAFAAEDSDEDVVINASVAEECSLSDIGPIELGDIAIVTASGANALQITGVTSTDVTGVWVSCNYNNKMTLSVPSPLVSASSAGLGKATGSADFTNEIQYRFRAVNYANSPEANSFANASVTSNQSAPIHKQITFRAIVDGANQVGARPYAADDYTATANVYITTL